MLSRIGERKITHKNNIEVKFFPRGIVENMEEYPKLLLKNHQIPLFAYQNEQHAEWTIKKGMEYCHLNNS